MSTIKPSPEGLPALAARMTGGHQAIIAAIDAHAAAWTAAHHGAQLASETGVLRAVMPAMEGQYGRGAVPAG